MAQQRISGLINRGDDAGNGRAFLGVFGKHPGWNDHIDDIGLATDRLVQIKRILYVEGIGGNIDAGAWDALPEAGRLPDFDHVFLWRAGGELVLGRFWSSSDGKGRKRYPMVVAAQVPGWPVSWQLKYVMPVLERLEEEFKAATTADRVIALAQNAQKELEALTSGDPAPSTRFDATATSALAADQAMGPERRGMYRLLYQMERDLGAYLRGGGKDSSRSRTVDLSPRHLRVPRCNPDETASLLLWWRFMGEHLGDSTPLVLISPAGAGWIDILVGEPGVSQFTCVRSNEQTVPLTTEIPYTFDAPFVARADERIAGATPPPTADQAGKKSPGVTAPNVGKAIDTLKAVRGMEPRQLAMLVGAAVLGLIVIIGVIVLVSGGMSTVKPDQSPPGNSGPSTPRPDANNHASGGSNPAPAATANPNFGQPQRDDFAEWCDSVEWALDLRQRLAGRDLAPLQADQHLAQTLVPLLETLRDPAFEIDPRTATPGGPRQLANLKSAPPASAQTDEGIAKTAAALRVCRGIRAAVQPTAWPARSLLDRFAVTARQAGWAGLGDAIAGVSEGVTLTGPTTFDSLERVVRTARPIDDLQNALSRFNQARESLASVSDPRLARLGDLLQGVDPGSGAPPDRAAAAAARMDSLASLAAELDQTAKDRWPRMDVPYFLASAPLDPPASGLSEAYIRQWIQEANRDAYTLLADSADPRQSWDIPRRADAMRAQLASLKEGGSQVDPAVIASLEQRLSAAGQTLEQARGLEWNRTNQRQIAGRAADLDSTLGAIESEYEAITGRLAEQWERVTTRLRERASIPGISSPALNRAWVQRRDALLAAFTSPDRLAALNTAVENLEDFLQRVDHAIPTPPMPAERPRAISADALESAIAAERERTVEALLARATWTQDRYDDAALDTQAATQAQGLSRWGERVGTAARDMARAEALLAGAYGPDEAASDGATLAGLMASAGEDKVGAAVAAVFTPLREQVGALQGVAQARQPAPLAASAADPRAPLGVSLAAWRALPAAGWPADPTQLTREGELARALLARVAAVSDASRRSQLEAEIRNAQAARWTQCATRVQSGPDQSALRQVLASREAFGVALDALAPALRFSALAQTLARDAADLNAASDDARVKGMVAKFLADVDALSLPADALAPARAWLDELRALVDDQQAAPVIDPTTLGPATAGWRGQEIDDRRVRFTSPDASHWIEFMLVEPGDAPSLAEPAYICTNELSVGLLGVAAGGEHLAALRRLIAESPPESGAGPKTWLVWTRSGQDSITPADAWYGSADVATGIQAFATPPTPARPGAKTPVTHLGASTASEIAGWLGCRLPTIGEWQAGLARYENGGSGGDWNLRDAAWAAQQAHVRQVVSGGRLGIKYPDEGVFHPDASDAPTGESATSGGGSDGTLFFDDVDRPRGRVLLHMVGNVGEYVTLDGAGGGPRFGVIGRSALSAPEDESSLMNGAGLLPGDEMFGWADVGVRLAFPLSGEGVAAPLWRRAQRVGASAPVLVGVSSGAGG